MTKFTIDLPETFGFIRAGQTFNVAVGNFNAEIIAQLVMHGATQKIGDAAAGKDGDEAMAAMTAVYTSLSNGDWGRSRAGTGEEPVMRFIREFIRQNLGAENKAKYAALKGDGDARVEFLNGLYEAQTDENRDAIRAEAETRMAEERAKAEAAKKRAAKLAIGL